MKFLVEATGGVLVNGMADTVFRRVCTDSRQVQAGDLFIAIKGETFDGHQFVPEVAAKGVAGVVVARTQPLEKMPGCAVLTVADPRVALGQLAAAYRNDFSVPVIAVGGSNGKTTTKELVASVLGEKLVTLRSEASFNNDIGVPMTVLRLEKKSIRQRCWKPARTTPASSRRW